MPFALRAPNSLRTLWVIGADRAFFIAVVLVSLLVADRIAVLLAGSGSGMPVGL